MQERGIENTGLFDMEVINTCGMDTDAIISYAAIHHNLTKEDVMNYAEYPSREEMAQQLSNKHIGYDFVKDKPYDWGKLARSKDSKMRLQTTWLADKLNKNVGDICRVESFPQCDLLTFSFPCTDLSIAGRQAGMVEGETRSGLVYEVLRILKNMEAEDNLPTYLLMENVDALVNKKNKPQYEALNEEFADLGYDVKWQVLNGKNCGVPQNRSRIFAIYWLRDKVDLSNFEFPKPFDDGRRLKDILMDEVDEKYYITNERAQALIRDLVMNDKVLPTEETVKKK
jgi:DNA (cytosine-5)-methyltransferase 1